MIPKPRIIYYYHNDVGSIYYGASHPMKPIRIRMAHSLILSYNLYQNMTLYRPPLASSAELTRFHSDDYVQFLSRINADNASNFEQMLSAFNVGEDCPIFDGMYELCQISSGGSIASAQRINHGKCDIAINWAGGLHHAKKAEASGFCYINDIVLCILELLKYHARVLYVDIDIHHGDGVEEAFYTTDRVMTVSFHKYGEFFPGTGDIADIGSGPGRGYSVNVPLMDGIDDESYLSLFRPVMSEVMLRFRPSAVVLQCGADSLAGDRLGCFNLSLAGHGECVRFMQTFNVPMVVLGGGGYTVRNVARCWAYETGVLQGQPLDHNLPPNDYMEYYAKPDGQLYINTLAETNYNTPEYLERLRRIIFEQLRNLDSAPSVQVQDVPPDMFDDADMAEVDAEMDLAKGLDYQREALLQYKQHQSEFYDEKSRSLDRMSDHVDQAFEERMVE
ncbi:hypothetical protein GEMRC1_007291 [Eukaryota sp. GEM-RC1]